MKSMLKRIAAIILSAMLLLCVLPVQKAEAASAFKSSDLKYSLKKGKTTTFQSYIPKVGLKKHTAKLTQYSTKKVQAIDNGQILNLTLVRATMVVTLPKLTKAEAKKLVSSGYSKKNISYWEASVINLKSGKHALLYRPGDSTLEDIFEYTPVHSKKIKLANNVVYEYTDKYKVTCYCLTQTADKVALGIHGCKKVNSNYGKTMSSWYAGKLNFKNACWYSKNNKNLSAWIKIK